MVTVPTYEGDDFMTHFNSGVRERNTEAVKKNLSKVPFLDLKYHLCFLDTLLPNDVCKTIMLILLGEKQKRERLRAQFYRAVLEVNLIEIERLFALCFEPYYHEWWEWSEIKVRHCRWSDKVDAQTLAATVAQIPIASRPDLTTTCLAVELTSIKYYEDEWMNHHNIPMDSGDSFWRDPIEHVATFGSVTELQNLFDLAELFQVDLKLSSGSLCLGEAAEAGNVANVIFLLDKGFSVDSFDLLQCVKCEDHSARDQVMSILVARCGNDINVIDEDGESVLHFSCSRGLGPDEQYSNFVYLLTKGANPFLKDHHGCMPLDSYFMESVFTEFDFMKCMKFIVEQRKAIRDGLPNQIPDEIAAKVLTFAFPLFEGSQIDFLSRMERLLNDNRNGVTVEKFERAEALLGNLRIFLNEDCNWHLLVGV